MLNWWYELFVDDRGVSQRSTRVAVYVDVRIFEEFRWAFRLNSSTFNCHESFDRAHNST